MDRPVNPFRIGSVRWALMEGGLQEVFDGRPGWSDLTAKQIAEIFEISDHAVRDVICKIYSKTGFAVPFQKAKKGRSPDE